VSVLQIIINFLTDIAFLDYFLSSGGVSSQTVLSSCINAIGIQITLKLILAIDRRCLYGISSIPGIE
jgi:hypothetical protein